MQNRRVKQQKARTARTATCRDNSSLMGPKAASHSTLRGIRGDVLRVWRHRREFQSPADFCTEWGFFPILWGVFSLIQVFAHFDQSGKRGMLLPLSHQQNSFDTPSKTPNPPCLQPCAAPKGPGSTQRQVPAHWEQSVSNFNILQDLQVRSTGTINIF